MKVIYNRIIPFKGFKAINIFGIIFARKGSAINELTIRHESIHSAQMKELLFIGFYVLYFLEWLLRMVQYGFNNKLAYRNISFEKEAYYNEINPFYLQDREIFSWKDYL